MSPAQKPKAPRILWKTCGEGNRDRVGLCSGYRIELSYSHNPRTPANERYEIQFAGDVVGRLGELAVAKQYCREHIQSWIAQRQEHEARQRQKELVEAQAARDHAERATRTAQALVELGVPVRVGAGLILLYLEDAEALVTRLSSGT